MISDLIQAIEEDAARLTRLSQFKGLRAKESPFERGDVLVVNNSFLFRNTSTVKSAKYLALVTTGKDVFEGTPQIALPATGVNKDIKRFSSKSANLRIVPLRDAIKDELADLGSLVFSLVGELGTPVDVEVPLNATAFKSLKWSPAAEREVELAGNRIIVRDLASVDRILTELRRLATQAGIAMPGDFEETIIGALRKIQSDATVPLKVPKHPRSISENAFIDQITDTLRDEAQQYKKALHKWEETAYTDSASYDQILKISYNFAADAVRLLRLITSICDLKPLVLWGTIAEHFALSEAFKELYWTRSKKPFLEDYRQIVSDSRNSAFHNLFRFDTSIEILLPEGAITDARLKIFTEYSRQNKNAMLFKDKALADVLLEFTRTHMRRVPNSFWSQHLRVIDATLKLFTRTGEYVRLLLAGI